MMGTQLWLKESLFNFVETLLGSTESAGKGGVTPVDNELDDITRKLSKKPKLSKSEIEKEIKTIRERFNSKTDNIQTDKEKSERVDLSNWSIVDGDNSHKRDEKVSSLGKKLANYKKRGYIK